MNDAVMGDAELRLPIRVYIEDTDAGGIVFYVNYLKYFERARTEYLRRLGFAKVALLGDEFLFVVRSMQVEYLQAAVLDDELEACALLVEARGARLVFAQRMLRGDEEICRARITVACIDRVRRRPRVMPPALREAIESRIPPADPPPILQSTENRK